MKIMDLTDIGFVNNVQITKADALIVVDMQYDFMPGGALPVNDGNHIIEGINTVAKVFKNNGGFIVFTQDWHPKDHLSFASSHPGKDPGDEYQTSGIGPVLWPDHCVQGSEGANFHKDLNTALAYAIIRKGYNYLVDSYSGFIDNDKKSETGLRGYLESLNIKRIFICGLALDYCCFATAMDGAEFGFAVFFLIDLTKGINIPPGNISSAIDSMKDKGIKFAKRESFV